MPGRDFVQNPGPTNIPDRILEAFRRPSVDFNSPEFAELVNGIWADLEPLFGAYRVAAYPSVGHGSWEATLVNLLEPGQRFLLPMSGLFSMRWGDMAESLGFGYEPVAVDSRRAPNPEAIHDALVKDKDHQLAGVFVAHAETSTGTLADLAAIRSAIDAAGHPALFVVDAIASFATDSVPMAELGIDVVLASSQKGLMMPPGLSFAGLSERAVAHNKTVSTPRSFWSWTERIDPEWVYQRFGGTPPEQHLFALRAALDLIAEEGGIDAVTTRHRRLAGAVHAAIEMWGKSGPFEINAIEPSERSSAVTAVLADGIDVAELISTSRDLFHVSIAGGMLEMRGRGFRIGHLGDLNEPMLLGALGGIECAIRQLGIPHESGLEAAVRSLTQAQSGR
ncbi:MAG: aminotransferase class V-fold PLP-dependent enzyme [Acidimicrobiales bacterium]